MHRTRLHAHAAWTAVALLVAGLAPLLAPLPGVAARGDHGAAGHVYVLNNNLGSPNSITVFTRAGDGALTPSGVTVIGGLGSLAAFADGTQGSLIRTRSGRRLFAVDAGSNQISVLDVHAGQLTMAGIFPSGGDGPVSLTYEDGLLYVLNAANSSPNAANVAGFRVEEDGTLHPIPGASKPLSAAHPNPAQVQLDPMHRYLLVSEKGTNLIDLYHVGRDGSLSGPTSVPATGAVPFGMAFNPAQPQHLVVADALGGPGNTGGAAVYSLHAGTLQPIGGFVPDYQVAPCWMVISGDGRFAYTSDADSYAISGYRIHQDGTISLLNPEGVTARTPADTFPLEEGLSRDSRYLYVLDSRLLLPHAGPATLSGFRVHNDGSLTAVLDPAGFLLPLSAIGLASD